LDNRNDHAVVKLLSDLGRSVGIDVTAEGIEVDEQLDWLRQLQVPYAQGFYLGMPAPADHLTALLRTGRPRGVARVPLEHHAQAGRHRREPPPHRRAAGRARAERPHLSPRPPPPPPPH